MGTGPHRGNRDVLADRARDENERHIDPLALQKFQRVQPAEAGHDVIGDDDIPRHLLQRSVERLRRIHARRQRGVAATPQLAQNQFVIVLRVFDDQRT